MNLGQVWSSADFDGIDSMSNEMNHEGGRGSVVAVCGQNPNLDAPLNAEVGDISIDWQQSGSCSRFFQPAFNRCIFWFC